MTQSTDKPSSIPHPEEQVRVVTFNHTATPITMAYPPPDPSLSPDLLKSRSERCICGHWIGDHTRAGCRFKSCECYRPIPASPPTTQDREAKMETPCVNCGYSKFEHDVENGWCFHGGSGEDATQYEPSQGWPVAVPFASPPSSPTSEPIPASDQLREAELLEALNTVSPSLESLPIPIASAFGVILESLASLRVENSNLRMLTKCVEGGIPIVTRYTEEYQKLESELASLRSSALTAEEAAALLTVTSGVLTGPCVRIFPKLRSISALRSSTADKGNTK